MALPTLRAIAILIATIVLFLAQGAAAVDVTDGVTTRSCAQGCVQHPTLPNTLLCSPAGCLKSTALDPAFTLKIVPTAYTQPSSGAAGVQVAEVYVIADKTPQATSTYTLSLTLCTAAQGCNPNAGNWYFFPYAALGGAGFTPQDQKTTGVFPFNFQANQNPEPGNALSMGVGRIEIPGAPLFSGTRVITLGLSGEGANTTLVTHTATGGGQAAAGADVDINGNLIPAPSGPVGMGSPGCSQVGQPPGPGAGGGPCGAYQISDGNCSAGMTGANAITTSWLYVLEDLTLDPYSPRIGNYLGLGVYRDHAMVFRFKTGPESAYPALSTTGYQGFRFSFNEYVPNGPQAPRFVAVSEKRCDFDYTKILDSGGRNACYRAMGADDTLNARLYRESTGQPSADIGAYCALKPNTYYYVSYRYEDARTTGGRGLLSCPVGQAGGGIYSACGATFTIFN